MNACIFAQGLRLMKTTNGGIIIADELHGNTYERVEMYPHSTNIRGRGDGDAMDESVYSAITLVYYFNVYTFHTCTYVEIYSDDILKHMLDFAGGSQ